MQSFPELPDESNKHHLKADADGSSKEMKQNHLKADTDGYLQSMTMTGWSRMLHSKENQSFHLDQMINETTQTLSNKSEPFEYEVKNFIATQAEIDAMVSNIPTPKAKQSNLIPMVLLLMQSINGTITNQPLVTLCDSGSSHCMFNKRALPFGATTFKTQKIKTTTTQGTYDVNESFSILYLRIYSTKFYIRFNIYATECLCSLRLID